VEFGEATADRASLVLSRQPSRAPIADGAAGKRLAALAARMGAKLSLGDTVTLSVPIRRDPLETPAADVAVAPAVATVADAPAAPTIQQ